MSQQRRSHLSQTFRDLYLHFQELALDDTVSEGQAHLLIQDHVQCPHRYQIYFEHLQIGNPNQLRFEDLAMLITEIEYYESVKERILTQKKELNLTPAECQLLITQLESSETEQRRRDFLCNPLIGEYMLYLRERIRACGDLGLQENYEKQIQKVREKQQRRWKAYVTQLQRVREQMTNQSVAVQVLEQEQKWRSFAINFQNQKFYKFNRMREEQREELENQKKQLKEQLQFKVRRHSKQLLELREKQKQLVKVRQYEKAQEMVMEIKELEREEEEKQKRELKSLVSQKLKHLKRQQRQKLNAFMQKVASEQATYILQKKQQESKWQNLNKNIIQDIGEKLNKERILTLASRKSFNSGRARVKSAHHAKLNFHDDSVSYLNDS